MTQAADQIREQRRHWAAPGGSHDRTVRFLARWLPGAVGVVAALMIVGPLFPRGEISFLLDRTKVAAVKERLRVADAMYRGEDSQGRPFTVTAGSAVQVSAADPVVTMQNLVIKDTHPDGYDQVKLNNTSTGSISRQAFTGVNITGGSKYLFKAMGTPTSAYRLSGWTKEGVAVANQLGW